MGHNLARAAGAALLALLAGCATTTGQHPTETRSGFDGTTTVDIERHGAACKSFTCIAVGAQWRSNQPDAATLTVAVVNSLTAITGAQVSIDGEVATLVPLPGLTTYSRPGDSLKESRKPFAVPLELVRRMTKGGNVWVRVSTPEGYMDEAINSPAGDSKALHALRRFVVKVDGAASQRQAGATPTQPGQQSSQ